MSFINQSAINTRLYLTTNTSYLAKEAIPVVISTVHRYFYENKIHLTPENNIGDPLCLIYWDNRQNLEGARVTTVSITTRARCGGRPPRPFPATRPPRAVSIPSLPARPPPLQIKLQEHKQARLAAACSCSRTIPADSINFVPASVIVF